MRYLIISFIGIMVTMFSVACSSTKHTAESGGKKATAAADSLKHEEALKALAQHEFAIHFTSLGSTKQARGCLSPQNFLRMRDSICLIHTLGPGWGGPSTGGIRISFDKITDFKIKNLPNGNTDVKLSSGYTQIFFTLFEGSNIAKGSYRKGTTVVSFDGSVTNLESSVGALEISSGGEAYYLWKSAF